MQNGNLINTDSLLKFMDAEAHRHINTNSDSELLLNIFADHLQQTGKFRINEEDIFKAIAGLMEQAKGAYACVAMLAGFGLIAFRDPNGIRPLGMAARQTPTGKDHLFASESVVSDALGFGEWQDIRPGHSFVCASIVRTLTSLLQARRSSSRARPFPVDRSARRRRSRQTSSNTCTSLARTRFWTA
jgi:glutamine phosphoribosylpyrophosphate amidotransferase